MSSKVYEREVRVLPEVWLKARAKAVESIRKEMDADGVDGEGLIISTSLVGEPTLTAESVNNGRQLYRVRVGSRESIDALNGIQR